MGVRPLPHNPSAGTAPCRDAAGFEARVWAAVAVSAAADAVVGFFRRLLLPHSLLLYPYPSSRTRATPTVALSPPRALAPALILDLWLPSVSSPPPWHSVGGAQKLVDGSKGASDLDPGTVAAMAKLGHLRKEDDPGSAACDPSCTRRGWSAVYRCSLFWHVRRVPSLATSLQFGAGLGTLFTVGNCWTLLLLFGS